MIGVPYARVNKSGEQVCPVCGETFAYSPAKGGPRLYAAHFEEIHRFTMRATYEDQWYESDEPDTFPNREGGFTDPENPWGGFRIELPERENPGPEWYADNVKIVEFDTVQEAAEFALAFPGGVWDYSESEYETVDYGTGRERQVTLHIDGTRASEVFDRMAAIEEAKKKWKDDGIQFPRLLAEILAVGLTAEQITGLCESMDLEEGDVYELFNRADDAWERAKGNR